MLRRLLHALALWQPTVVVERVDLSDGETLQVLGHGHPRRVDRLSFVARSGRTELRSAADVVTPAMVGTHAGHAEFHAWIALPPAQATDGGTHDVIACLRVGRRRARIVWGADAFENPNAEVCRPVLPDPGLDLQRALRRESRDHSIRVITTPAESRVVVRSTHLGDVCRLGISPSSGTSVTAVSWVDGANHVDGRSVDGLHWEWDDLAALAVEGTRWSLRAVTADGGEGPVHLPLTDLRQPGLARVFPTTTVSRDGQVSTLALGVDGGNRVVIRCRATEAGQ